MGKKIIFFGNHNVGYECLKFLIDRKYDIACVVVNTGERNKIRWYNSVWNLAIKNNLKVMEADEIKEKHGINKVKNMHPDLLLSVSFNEKILQALLKIPKYGAYNFHGSYLPDYKGRFCSVWAILNGEKFSGVSLHEMTDKIDSGRIVARKKIKIYSDTTAIELFNRQIRVTVELLEKNINKLFSYKTKYLNVDNTKGRYFSGRNYKENKIKWNDTSQNIDKLVRAAYFPPHNFAYTFLKGKKVNIKKIFIKDDYYKTNDNTKGKIIASIENCPLVSTKNGCCLILDSDLKAFSVGDCFEY